MDKKQRNMLLLKNLLDVVIFCPSDVCLIVSIPILIPNLLAAYVEVRRVKCDLNTVVSTL